MSNQNHESIKKVMMEYAVDKYGCEFSVESYQVAKDETYSNILSLNDGTVVFNVYQSEDLECSDDYAKAIINKKVKEMIESDFDIFINCILKNGSELSYEYASKRDVMDILSNYSLLKLIVVVKVDEDISNLSDELYYIYKEAMNLTPKYIDFEVIEVEKTSNELNSILNNLLGFYSNDWNKFSEIISYLAVKDTNVTSAEELVGGVK